MAFLTTADLTPFAAIEPMKAQQMIDDAEALATLAAPCLAAGELTDGQTAAVRAIIRGAILRWNDAGSGALQQGAIDDFRFAMDNRQTRKGMFWPSEIVQLQNICGGTGSSAYSIDTAPTDWALVHLDVCSVNFGASYCTCGAVLSLGTAYFPS